MSYAELVTSHVERCLQDIWAACRVEADLDGDYPFRRGSAAGYVRVEPGEPTASSCFAKRASDA